DLAISVCDRAAASSSRSVVTQRQLHWPMDDPARASGLPREQLIVFRRVRDELRANIRQFLERESGITPAVWAMDEETKWEAQQLVELALAEDLGPAGLDATSQAVVPQQAAGCAVMVARRGGIIAGMEIVQWVSQRFPGWQWTPLVRDGDRLVPYETIGVLRGNARQILTAERTILNFVGRMSGVASLTGEFVDRVAGTAAGIYDTRKTLPGWRRLDKYAVRWGGGHNHRMGLHDAILIKDNHLMWMRTECGHVHDYVGEAVRRARHWVADHAGDLPHGNQTPVQIEVDRLEQLASALTNKPDMILLDNFSVEELRQAVRERDAMGSRTILEASGGVNLQTVGEIAKTGVERISIGALTHSAPALDVALDWEPLAI
ncbi:MAG TPA: carboxylating nicotinate-nucleotide diphosphorylase, partial [Pirellulaceae bacterium]|nr:carboxylating nicotinate-nucleotide diphosphorylase [Pirellulaceae bacterium]